MVIARGEHWTAVLMIAPVYLTYKTYHVFIGRLEDRDRHAAEARRLHQETVSALSIARNAERELAAEKDRLAETVAELTRLEVTRQELLERERAARASAEEGNRLKDQFLATVSHELRTPLNAILGWADMLRTQKIDEPMRERANQSIYENARRQARMIDELLDVARIVSGKLRLERTAVDLEQVVRAALEMVQAAAEAKQLTIVVNADPSIDDVYGDASRLQQIVWNLLSNAVKFSEDRGRVVVRLARAQGATEITVTDDGVGIPQEFLPWVFEPFRQADASSTRLHGGLGLGLSIVKHLVEAHGGTISASSAGEGFGSTFIVRLPIRADRAIAAPPQSAGVESAPMLDGVSVLVVDDDPGSRDVAAAHLRSRHAVVRTAESSAEAIEILRTEHVDVLLADIAMPGEDGYALIRKVRDMSRRVESSCGGAYRARSRGRQAARPRCGISTAPLQAHRGPRAHCRGCEPRRPSDLVTGARVAALPHAGHISPAEVYMKSQFMVLSGTAVLALGVGVLAQTPAQSQPTSSSPTTQAPAKQITITGCVQSESDYRRAKDLGRGGVAATGVGAANEFVIIGASSKPADAARDPGAPPAAATGTSGTMDAYEATGSTEGDLKQYVGKRVEITGVVKAAEKMAGKPTGGTDPIDMDLKLPELEIATVRAATGDCPVK